MKYIIKISPEITIKSKPVRKRAILMLKNNIAKHLRFEEIKGNVSGNWDQLQLHISEDGLQGRIIQILKSISGIAYFMEVEGFDMPKKEEKKGDENEKDTEIFDGIFLKVKQYFGRLIEGRSFVVRVKRSGQHDFRSVDLERYIGGGLLQHAENTKVDLHNPDYTVKINVKDNKFFIIKSRIEGMGGYPIGFQDKVISLISGGFDSGVSTFSLMKRGCLVDYLFFNLGGSAHELGVKQVSYYLWKTFSVPHKKARFITVPFEGIVKELLEKVDHRYRGIILKRLMLRAASLVAEGNYYAAIKGDSLGQVSSQTLKNMYVIDKASDILVLRPLIGMNKQEIIDISKEIGTYDFACSMPEYCGVISDKPATGAKLEEVLEAEKNMSKNILEEAFLDRKIEFVKDMLSQSGDLIDIEEVSSVSKNELIIDLREPEKVKNHPLEKGESIPFYDINHKFPHLDQEKTYLFYCEKGILSKLHGLYLREKGFNNIKIFRPENMIKK